MIPPPENIVTIDIAEDVPQPKPEPEQTVSFDVIEDVPVPAPDQIAVIEIEETEPAEEGPLRVDIEEPGCPDPETMCPERDDGMMSNFETGELEPSVEDMKELAVDIMTDIPLPSGFDHTFDIDFEKVIAGPATYGADGNGCPCKNNPKMKFVPSVINV